jgi:hypothetical protein
MFVIKQILLVLQYRDGSKWTDAVGASGTVFVFHVLKRRFSPDKHWQGNVNSTFVAL